MKKIIAVIVVMASLALLFAACSKDRKSVTVESFEGCWHVTESTIEGEPNNLGRFSHVASEYAGGGIRISGERICQFRNFEHEMAVGDFCTFEVKDGGKLAFHDIGMDGFPAIGDFEADYTLEGSRLTLTQGTTVIVLEKR